MNNKMQFINPYGLSRNPAFSQVVMTQGNGKTIYIGGQDSVNAQREIVGRGDIAGQTEQVMNKVYNSETQYSRRTTHAFASLLPGTA